MTKSKSVNWKKFLSILLVLMMTMSILAIPVSAATSSKSLSNSRTATVNVCTGSGWQYSLGWKKTTVTITNTSKSGAITVYSPIGVPYLVQKGRSITFTLSGSAKTYKFGVQRSGIGTRSYRVTSSAGSIW